MNVASLELCKELYELSAWGWSETDQLWRYHKPNGQTTLVRFWDHVLASQRYQNNPETPRFKAENDLFPAYDLGYLLRKLPEGIESQKYPGRDAVLRIGHEGGWFGWYHALNIPDVVSDLGTHGYTPEDAACKLAIKLFKSGILKREDSQK